MVFQGTPCLQVVGNNLLPFNVLLKLMAYENEVVSLVARLYGHPAFVSGHCYRFGNDGYSQFKD